MIGLLFLGLVAVIVVVAMVLVLKQDDPVTTSTSNTATSTGTMSTAIVTSTSSTSSTTTPEMNTVSETSTLRACSYFVNKERCLTPSSFDLNIRLPVRAPNEHSHRDQHKQHLQHDNARNEYRE
jgi:cytoskeletal protein RodZ